jgi:predicted small lipoprotein YifL
LHRSSHRPLARLALIGLFAAAMALTACGRKGPLDPPPGASLAGEPQPAAPGLISGNHGTSGSKARKSEDGQAQAPTGPNKRIPLDSLLN